MLTPAIIYEDNHLLIVQKPPGFLAQPDNSSRPDILTWAGEYLARHKPGRAYVGLTHRLDRAVGGVMALAKTSKAASRLSRQFRERTVKKIYIALVTGSLSDQSGRLEQLLVRDGSVTRPAEAGEKGTLAVLDWRVRRRFGEYTRRGSDSAGTRPSLPGIASAAAEYCPSGALLEVDLSTGFKHQIRAQLAALGHPIVGDLKYGGRPTPEGPAIGLWAESLALDHPTLKERLTFEAAPAAIWPWNLVNDGTC